MLRVWIKERDKGVPEEFTNRIKPSDLFRQESKDDWFMTDWFKRVVEVVDKSTVLRDGRVCSPMLGNILPYNVSGGAKALTLIAFYDDPSFNIWSAFMGDNCMPLLGEALAIRESLGLSDLRFIVSSEYMVDESLPVRGVCVQTGREFKNWYGLVDEVYKMECDF